jgi:aspartyl-tRNA(Asn)/glutamyl-tRNA(Gln) amidotransferase subunit C
MNTNSTSRSGEQSSATDTRDLILRMAHLARLSLKEHEVESFSGQLGSILHYIDQIKTLDVAGVDPLLSPASLMRNHAQRPREDIPLRPDSDATSRLLACAPEGQGSSFGVPPVL